MLGDNLTLGIIISAAAADSINPCVFGVLIFLIAFMLKIFKSPGRMLLGGFLYTAVVYGTYLLLGFGILKLALNTGLPLAHPSGGFYFVFQAGVPMFRRYARDGTLLFERHIEGPETDPLVQGLPTMWPRRKVEPGGELPLVPPTVRTAAVDPDGRLWVALTIPFTYVYDVHGDKIRTVQFRGAGLIAPTSLSFADRTRLLVTPGCYEFTVR